jgi:hypothetical protein
MTLLQRFRFYKQRNAPALAYYFARRKHVGDGYSVPEFLVVAWVGGRS